MQTESLEIINSLLEADAEAQENELCLLVKEWLTTCDRAETCEDGEINECHAVGIALCALMQNSNFPVYTTPEEVLGEHESKIMLHDSTFQNMTWQQISDTVTALQLEVPNFVQYDNDEGYTTSINCLQFCCQLMKRMGFFVTHEMYANTHETNCDVELAHGVSEIVNDEWTAIKIQTITPVLDALHAITGLVNMLLQAEPVTMHQNDLQEQLPIYNHHREASLDDFYEISMISDLMPGSITQYKHQFTHLFHSVSQVLYFHYPHYARKIQISLSELQKDNVSPVHLLPLLRQLHPEIPVLYEHTGATLKSAHEKNKFSWCCMSGFVLLVDSTSCSKCSKDLRTLLIECATSKSDNHISPSQALNLGS